jgi:hypothetical protein
VYAIASPGGTRLLLRHYDAGQAGGKPAIEPTQEVELPGRLAGSITVIGNTLVVPLSDGKLVRFTLPLGPRVMPEVGPNWRSRGASLDTSCHLVRLGEDEFLSTDGSKGVTRWQWKPGAGFKKGNAGEGPTVALDERLVGVPLVLPRANAQAPLQAMVANRRGEVVLLRGEDLAVEQTWDLKGSITTGPFLRGSQVGCVVDHSKLVWLDPTKREPLWTHSTGGEPIIGEPRQIGDLIVVCDAGGKFVGLDPKTGKPAGDGYTLKALVAPATTPVPFGPGRAFAPLTDGTIMLLSLDRLRGK